MFIIGQERIALRFVAVTVLVVGLVFGVTVVNVAWAAEPGTKTISKEKTPEPVFDVTVDVHAQEVLVDGFLGVGVEWSAYPWWDVSKADWEKVFRRLEFMRLPMARVMLDTFWYCQGIDDSGKPSYTWDTPHMKKLYTLLDWCESHNTLVIIGEWGRPNGKDLDLAADDPRWTRIVADFVEYMLNERGYTCLKYYNLVNEPHGSWSGVTWDEWYTAINNLQAEFKHRGLLERIKIAAPDGDRLFTTKCLKYDCLRELTGIYDEHWYVRAIEVEYGLLELYTREQLRQMRRVDAGKHFILGEMGLMDDKTENDQQLHVYDFWYGVSMADAAIQMIRGGMSGFIAWDLDDSMHFVGDGGESMNALSDALPANAYQRRKIWGFWSILGEEFGMPEDENMRPWFYPWSLLSRAFPPGCSTLAVDCTEIRELRVAAAKIPTKGGYHVSVAIANNSKWPRRVKIRIPEAKSKVTFGVYEYFDGNGDNVVDSWPRVVDDAGNDVFPQVCKKLEKVKVSSGWVVTLPSKGITILTSLEFGEPVAFSGN